VRLRIEDPSEFSKNSIEKPVIMCFWHNRILGITLAFLKRYPHRLRKGVNVLTSASRDGEILAQIMGQLGMAAVRGSSSRRGSRAMRELIDLIENGYDVAITGRTARATLFIWSGAISLAPCGCPSRRCTRNFAPLLDENVGWFHHPVVFSRFS
jgi:lysophospholipid acyltransferase (LPLAT)-like uncharacterized protein